MMVALVIGKSPIAAEQLGTFCDMVLIAIDNSYMTYRHLPEYEKYEILLSKVDISSACSVFSKSREIRWWIKLYNVSIVYTNTKWDMVAARLATLFVKNKVVLISTNHNSYAWLDYRRVKLMSWLIRFSTHYYIALASFVYNYLKGLGLSERRLLLLPNTVSYENWRVKKDYTMHSTIKLVYVANVYEGKAQDFLIELLHAYKGKYKLCVDCYGDLMIENQSYIDRLNHLSAQYGLNGYFNLKGRIENEDLRKILCDYDIYISPSRMEMSPVNILEAFAAGVPVIAANVGGVSDIVCDNQTGILYRVDCLEEAIAKLNTLLNNLELRQRLGISARKYVAEIYTKNIAGEKINRAINRM